MKEKGLLYWLAGIFQSEYSDEMTYEEVAKGIFSAKPKTPFDLRLEGWSNFGGFLASLWLFVVLLPETVGVPFGMVLLALEEEVDQALWHLIYSPFVVASLVFLAARLWWSVRNQKNISMAEGRYRADANDRFKYMSGCTAFAFLCGILSAGNLALSALILSGMMLVQQVSITQACSDKLNDDELPTPAYLRTDWESVNCH